MRIKPYRVCDICGKEYQKTHGAMKVKMLYDPMRYCDMYGDLRIMERMDICPKCSELMLEWIQTRQDEPQTETSTNSEKVQLKVQLTDEPQTDVWEYHNGEWTEPQTDCAWK